MKSGITSLERLRLEISQIERELAHIQQRIAPIQQELSKTNQALIPFHAAIAPDPNLLTPEQIQRKDALSKRLQALKTELKEPEERIEELRVKLLELDQEMRQEQQRLKIEKTRAELEPLVLSKLEEITHVKWIEDEKKYGKGVIATEPFEDIEKARQFHDLFLHQMDTESNVAKSPRGEYVRVFAMKNKVLEGLVKQELVGGHALDIGYLFEQLKDKPRTSPR